MFLKIEAVEYLRLHLEKNYGGAFKAGINSISLFSHWRCQILKAFFLRQKIFGFHYQLNPKPKFKSGDLFWYENRIYSHWKACLYCDIGSVLALANICILYHCFTVIFPVFLFSFPHHSHAALPQSFLALLLLLKLRKIPPSCDPHNYNFPILQVHNKEYLCKANIRCSRAS